jgi:hypothetical protein
MRPDFAFITSLDNGSNFAGTTANTGAALRVDGGVVKSAF